MLVVRTLIRAWRLDVAFVGLVALMAVAGLAPSRLTLPEAGALTPVQAPIRALLATAGALLVLQSLTEPVPQVFALSSTRRRLSSPGRCLVLTALVVAALGTATGGDYAAITLAVSALVGEGLLNATVTGPRLSWLLPTAHALVGLTLGAVNRYDLSAWAWVVNPRATTPETFLSIGLLLIGLTAWTARGMTAHDATRTGMT